MSLWSTLAIFKESSTRWIARQCHDHDAKQRVTSYKSRTTFNLLEVDSQLSIPDLGVAPRGWSQVVSQHSGHGSGEDSELLPSTLPRVRSECRPADSPCRGSDYYLNIDNMEDRSESKGRGTASPSTLKLKHDQSSYRFQNYSDGGGATVIPYTPKVVVFNGAPFLSF